MRTARVLLVIVSLFCVFACTGTDGNTGIQQEIRSLRQDLALLRKEVQDLKAINSPVVQKNQQLSSSGAQVGLRDSERMHQTSGGNLDEGSNAGLLALKDELCDSLYRLTSEYATARAYMDRGDRGQKLFEIIDGMRQIKDRIDRSGPVGEGRRTLRLGIVKFISNAHPGGDIEELREATKLIGRVCGWASN